MCAGLIAYVVAPVAAVCVLWIMLMRWQARVERGEQVWFMRWNAWLLAGLTIGLPLAADSLSPHHFEIWSIQYEMARRVIEVVTDVAYAAGWAWWLAQGRRHWLLPIAGAALWVAWSVALTYVHLAAGSLWIVSRDFLNMSAWLWQLAQYAAAGASLYAVVRIIARNRSASGRVSVAR